MRQHFSARTAALPHCLVPWCVLCLTGLLLPDWGCRCCCLSAGKDHQEDRAPPGLHCVQGAAYACHQGAVLGTTASRLAVKEACCSRSGHWVQEQLLQGFAAHEALPHSRGNFCPAPAALQALRDRW